MATSPDPPSDLGFRDAELFGEKTAGISAIVSVVLQFVVPPRELLEMRSGEGAGAARTALRDWNLYLVVDKQCCGSCSMFRLNRS